MQASATRSSAVTLPMAIAATAIAIVGGAVFALDTYRRGWSVGAVTGTSVAILAGVCAGIGRAAQRPALERASRIIAFGSVIVGLATVAYHALV